MEQQANFVVDTTLVISSEETCKFPDVYKGKIEDVCFPTSKFEVVHLERTNRKGSDFGNLINEISRISSRTAIISFNIDTDQFDIISKNSDIEITYIKPIDDGFELTCRTMKKHGPTVLVPSGIGDAFWSLTKIQGCMQSLGITELPIIRIQAQNDKQRSSPLIDRIPFVENGGYHIIGNNFPEFKEAYIQNARNLFTGVDGLDYFLAFNGGLRNGFSLEQLHPEWPVVWYPPMFEPKAEERYGKQASTKYGKYIVAYFVHHGMYQTWLQELNVKSIYKILLSLSKQTGTKIIFVGSPWDVGSTPKELVGLNAGKDNFIDLTGQTNLDELFGLMKHSEGVIGFPSGITCLAPVFKIPTVMIWSTYFVEPFHANCCPPDSLHKWYEPVLTYKHTPDEIVQIMRKVMEEGRDHAREA